MAEPLSALMLGPAYIDAVVLIAHLAPRHPLSGRCTDFLERASGAEPAMQLVTASLTLDEIAIVLLQELVAEAPFNVSRDRTTYLQRHPATVRQLASVISPQLAAVCTAVSVTSVTEQDVVAMARNMGAYGLLPRDAIHVAVAQRLGIEAIVSDAEAFDRVPGITLYKPEPGA